VIWLSLVKRFSYLAGRARVYLVGDRRHSPAAPHRATCSIADTKSCNEFALTKSTSPIEERLHRTPARRSSPRGQQFGAHYARSGRGFAPDRTSQFLADDLGVPAQTGVVVARFGDVTQAFRACRSRDTAGTRQPLALGVQPQRRRPRANPDGRAAARSGSSW